MFFWKTKPLPIEEEILEEEIDDNDEFSAQPKILTYRNQDLIQTDPDKVWFFCQDSFDSKIRIFDLNQQVLLETTILGDRLDKYLNDDNTMYYNTGSKSTNIRPFNNADITLKNKFGSLSNGRWIVIDELLINSEAISKIETVEKTPYQIKFEYKISVACDDANPKNRAFLKESNYQQTIDKYYLTNNLAIHIL
jgi:hypothetical protein